MPEQFSHFLITRFNIGFKSRYPEESVRREWMESRIAIFEKTTLPSICAQTEKNFTWLILFDPSTCKEHPDFIQKLQALDFCEPVFHESKTFASQSLIKTEISKRLDPSVRHVLTTRLDSDDAVHQDYIKDFQAHFEPGKNYIVNFTDGFAYSQNHLSEYKRNMVLFATFYECLDSAELKTVYCVSHAALKKVAPVKYVHGKPMYIYYYHANNISNNQFKITSFLKLPLDIAARFLCKHFSQFNRSLRYSYKVPVDLNDPRIDFFHVKL